MCALRRGHAAPQELPAAELQLHRRAVREPDGGEPEARGWGGPGRGERLLRAHGEPRRGREAPRQGDFSEDAAESEPSPEMQIAPDPFGASQAGDRSQQEPDQSEEGPVRGLAGSGAHLREALR